MTSLHGQPSLNPEKRYLVAVSGGVDSVALLHWMQDRGLAHGVVHVDHMLRDESAADAAFVRELTRSLALPYFEKQIDVYAYCKGDRRSIEDGAREVRRAFINEVMAAFHYDYVVLGHHADDQAETILNNILRGPSVLGLAGMLAVDDESRIVRPFIRMPKERLIEYAVEHGLSWVEDATNHEEAYDRNWLRNNVIPAIEERRPLRQVLSRKTAYFQALAGFLEDQTGEWMKTHYDEGFYRGDFLALHPFMRGEVLGWLWKAYHGTKNGFSETVVAEVSRWLDGNPQGGSKIAFGRFRLTIRKHRVTKDEKKTG